VSSTLTYLLIGLLQGVLEWLPISSQGNLVILMTALLGMEASQALDLSVFIHLGTGLAALLYFRREVVDVLLRRTERDRGLFNFLLVTTLITGIIGLPLFIFAKSASLYGDALLVLTGVALLFTGVVQRKAEASGGKSSESLNNRDGFALGFSQGLSALPGLSRSGLTTSVLLFKGFSGAEAFRISFLMSIPASFAAVAGLVMIDGMPLLGTGTLISILASFVSALLTIDLLLKLARRIRFWSLCVVLGLIALLPQVMNLF
jgi:undecaprenyl-diphosphatase